MSREMKKQHTVHKLNLADLWLYYFLEDRGVERSSSCNFKGKVFGIFMKQLRFLKEKKSFILMFGFFYCTNASTLVKNMAERKLYGLLKAYRFLKNS